MCLYILIHKILITWQEAFMCISNAKMQNNVSNPILQLPKWKTSDKTSLVKESSQQKRDEDLGISSSPSSMNMPYWLFMLGCIAKKLSTNIFGMLTCTLFNVKFLEYFINKWVSFSQLHPVIWPSTHMFHCFHYVSLLSFTYKVAWLLNDETAVHVFWTCHMCFLYRLGFDFKINIAMVPLCCIFIIS